jgi:hypothetical protein
VKKNVALFKGLSVSDRLFCVVEVNSKIMIISHKLMFINNLGDTVRWEYPVSRLRLIIFSNNLTHWRQLKDISPQVRLKIVLKISLVTVCAVYFHTFSTFFVNDMLIVNRKILKVFLQLRFLARNIAHQCKGIVSSLWLVISKQGILWTIFVLLLLWCAFFFKFKEWLIQILFILFQSSYVWVVTDSIFCFSLFSVISRALSKADPAFTSFQGFWSLWIIYSSILFFLRLNTA